MNAGAYEYPGMGKDGHSLIGLALELVKKCRHQLLVGGCSRRTIPDGEGP